MAKSTLNLSDHDSEMVSQILNAIREADKPIDVLGMAIKVFIEHQARLFAGTKHDTESN